MYRARGALDALPRAPVLSFAVVASVRMNPVPGSPRLATAPACSGVGVRPGIVVPRLPESSTRWMHPVTVIVPDGAASGRSGAGTAAFVATANVTIIAA